MSLSYTFRVVFGFWRGLARFVLYLLGFQTNKYVVLTMSPVSSFFFLLCNPRPVFFPRLIPVRFNHPLTIRHLPWCPWCPFVLLTHHRIFANPTNANEIGGFLRFADSQHHRFRSSVIVLLRRHQRLFRVRQTPITTSTNQPTDQQYNDMTTYTHSRRDHARHPDALGMRVQNPLVRCGEFFECACVLYEFFM